MKTLSTFNLITDDFDIDTTCGIRYTINVDLTITDLLEFAPYLLIDILLNNTKENIVSVEDDNYISFNKYGEKEFNFDFECCNEIKKRYLAQDNSPVSYLIELCCLTPEMVESLPTKIREALPAKIEYTRPKLVLEKPEVKLVSVLPDDIKRVEHEGDYTYQGFPVHYKDLYVWCDLERKFFKDYLSPHKKFYWEPLNNKFSAQFASLESMQNLFNDIAEYGIRTEVRFEINSFGQLSSIIDSGNRFLAAMFLGLPIIPACLIYRQHLSIPFMGPNNNYDSQNKEFIEKLNELYYPDAIFRYFDGQFPNLSNNGNVYYNESLGEILQFIKSEFPNKIYCSNEELPVKYQEMLKNSWNTGK